MLVGGSLASQSHEDAAQFIRLSRWKYQQLPGRFVKSLSGSVRSIGRHHVVYPLHTDAWKLTSMMRTGVVPCSVTRFLVSWGMTVDL